MRVTFIIKLILLLGMVPTNARSQTPKPYMDSLYAIISNVSLPPEIRIQKKTVFGFIVIQMSKKLEVQRLVYSKSLPATVVARLEESAKPRLSKLKWESLFPTATRQEANNVLIPFWFGTEQKIGETLTSTDVWKLFSGTMEIKQLQKASSMVITEPVKVELLYKYQEGSR